MATIGSRIRDRRLELGMSADDLAARLGKNRATIYRYESNEIENLPVAVIGPLSDALQVSPAYLMGWIDNAQPECTWASVFRDRLSGHLCNIDTTDAESANANMSRLWSIAEGEVAITLQDAYEISGDINISFLYLCGITDEDYEEKPTPVSEDGLDDMEKLLIHHIRDLTPDQQQMLLAQMQVMKKSQKEALRPSALE